jgi:hypothetical protein
MPRDYGTLPIFQDQNSEFFHSFILNLGLLILYYFSTFSCTRTAMSLQPTESSNLLRPSVLPFALFAKGLPAVAGRRFSPIPFV